VKYLVKYFRNISKISRRGCNKVGKPVKGLLLCMKSNMYFLLISYTLIMFLKVLSHFIMKIKNFVKYFKEGVLKYFFQNFHEIFKYFKVKYIFHHASIPTYM